MTGLASVDEQLTAVQERREAVLDLLCRCLIELDTLATRADVLLDRRLANAP
jgi:hypothetical protein